MTWALASEPPRSDHISPIPVTRVVRGKKRAVYPANYRSPRTRANSRELRANSPTVRQHRQSAELRRTFAGVRRTFAGVRRSSPGFARVRAHSAANSRTVRQKIRSPEEIYPPLTVVRREQVRRERSSPMANYSSPKSIFWIR